MNFQEGFREALPYWLNQAFSTTQDRVERAVQVDQVPLGFCTIILVINVLCCIHNRNATMNFTSPSQLQPLQAGAVPIKHSSSAVDLVACIQPVCQLWEQLSWPDPEEAFMLMVKITEVNDQESGHQPPSNCMLNSSVGIVFLFFYRTCVRLW